MAEKNEKLEELRKEVEEAKVKKEQDEHELIRRNNQIAKLTKTERSRRTNRLCSNAGYLESIFPVIKNASKTDFIQFCEGLLRIPGVKQYAKNFKPKPIEEVMK